MLIRQNPISQTAFQPETAYLCARLSRDIIHAHGIFIANYPSARATGYFTTSSLVECIYHLVPVLFHSRDESEQNACAMALDQAHAILIQISIALNIAKKALKAIQGVTNRWGSTGQSTRIQHGGSGKVQLGSAADHSHHRAPVPATQSPERIDTTTGQDVFSSIARNLGDDGHLQQVNTGLDVELWTTTPMAALFDYELEMIPSM